MRTTHVQFVGRRQELHNLQRLTSKQTSSLVVIKGRRRIGKSRLVEEFATKLTYYRFSGLATTRETTAQTQRTEFARQISEQFGLPTIMANDWADLLNWLGKQTQKGQFVILLDEIAWMGNKDDTFLAKLKNAWDWYFSKNPQLILILCGSVSAWIEKNILKSTGFFGRIAWEVTLDQLPLPICNQLLKKLGFTVSDFEKLLLFSLTGGIPWYLELINPSLTIAENIQLLCFQKDGILVKEYDRIFHDLFGRRSDIYRQIVATLTQGPKEYKKISEEIHYASGGPLSEYLEELILSGYICRDYTWNFQNGQPFDISKYRLADNYLRFYLRCIAPNLVKIQKQLFHKISLKSIPGWHSIMGLQFENLVLNNRQLIWELLHIKPEEIVNEGPYYQNATKHQQGCQIDYLIQTKFDLLYIFEIKFTQAKVGMSVVNAVKEKILKLKKPRGFACKPILIHAYGVTENVLNSGHFANIVDVRDLL